MNNDLRIVPAGDAALLVEFPAKLDPGISAQAVALAQAVRAKYRGTLPDVVVGYCSVTLYFDPLLVDAAWLQSGVRELAAELQVPAETAAGDRDVIDVAVCYGGEYGPDLRAVAAFAHGTEADVIALHTGVTYRVYMLGFVPGFPYMASVHPRLAMPRKGTPRTNVPPGSVAIAAGQTAIYPGDTPGGWHLIGRTHVKPYDPSRPEPFLFTPGDRVRFHSVGRAEFDLGGRAALEGPSAP
jgi:inhibitor of KinA